MIELIVMLCRVQGGALKTSILLMVFLLLPVVAFAQQNVLMLHSYHRGYEWTDNVKAGMEEILRRELPTAELFVENMDSKRQAPATIFPVLRRFLADKYAGKPFSVILASDDNALDFLLAYGQELFPGVPVVFCGINNFQDQRIAGHRAITGVTEEFDIQGTLEVALQLHPLTRTVAVVDDLSTSGRANLERVRQIAPRFENRIDFIELVGLRAADLRDALKRLPADSLVLRLAYFRDPDGLFFTVQQGNALIRESCPWPIYTVWDFTIQDGVVGGLVVSGRSQGKAAGFLALRILRGEKTENIAVVRRSPNVFMFDHQALKRFAIASSRLPTGSVIINDPDPRLRAQRQQLWLVGTLAGVFALLALALGFSLYGRRLATRAARNSEERFRSLVETASDWIWEVDAAGRYSYVSARVQDLLGYQQEEVLGKTPFELMPPAKVERAAEAFRRIVETRRSFHLLENVTLHRDGREIVLETSGVPFFDENGNLAGYRGIDRNITGRKKAEESLHLALHGLDSSISGITMADLGGTLTYANQAFQSMWGAASSHEFIGQAAFGLWENAEQTQAILPALSASGSWSGELTGVRRDGSRFMTQASAFLVRNQEDKPLCLMGAYMDITDRKEAEQALRESEGKLSGMLQSIADPIIMLDRSLQVLWANDAAKGFFGEDLVGKKCYQAIYCRNTPCPLSPCSALRCFQDGTRQEDERVWVDIHGEKRLFHCTATVALRDSDGRVTAVLKIARDITASKQTQEQLHLAKYALDSSLSPIILSDLQGRTTYVNQAFLDIVGHTSEKEVLGSDAFASIVDPSMVSDVRQGLQDKGEWRGELQAKTKDGTRLDLQLLSNVVKNPAGEPLARMGSFLDISEKKKAEQEIKRLAYFDGLTGLPNRTLLMDHMQLAFANAERAGKSVAVLLLDLDNFKQVNDTLGHAKGDRMLQQVAQRLGSALRKGDTLARWGGDEFVLLLNDIKGESTAATVACKVRELLAERSYDLEGSEVFSSASIGIALFPQNGADSETLLKHADTAMYVAKKDGRNDYHFFSEQMHQKAIERHTLESCLRRAMGNDEFFLVYQPQLDLLTGETVGMEALVRWQTQGRGLVSPAEFIPVAEDIGLIWPLGEWILRTACSEALSWQRLTNRSLRLAVNFSAQQFRQPDLVERIERVLQETGFDPRLLEMELTESVFMENMEAAIEVLIDLKSRGIQISIDDFGTGYSSLSYLKNFPIDRIKIAQEFVRDIPADPNDMAIVSATIAMAKSLGLKLIAEGVETREQLEFLQQQGCQEMQGYYFSRPLPAEQVAGFCCQQLNSVMRPL